MRKIDKYSYFYILSTSTCKNDILRDIDGREFRYLSDAVDFFKRNQTMIAQEGDNIFVMVWKEIFDENGNHTDNECVDDIYLSDIIQTEM